MNKNLNKAYFIVSLVGIILAFASAALVPLQIMFEAEISRDISVWANVIIIALLLASIIMSIFFVKGTFNKSAQICMATGMFAIFVYTLLNNLDVNLGIFGEILLYVFACMLTIGAILWIVTLFVKKFKSEEKAPYFFAFEMLVFGLTTLLTISGLIPNLVTSVAYMFAMRLLIGLITNYYYALELKHPGSNKPAFWFTVLLFIAVSFPMAIAFSILL